MEVKTNDLKEKHLKYQDFLLIPKKDPSQIEESLTKRALELKEPSFHYELNSLERIPTSPEEDYWLVIETCLKDIDKNYKNLDYLSKIRSSSAHIESLKELVKINSDISGIRNEYEVQSKQDEIVYLFKTGKNEWEFFKIFDELIESCTNYISNKRISLVKKGSEQKLEAKESKMIKEIKGEMKLKEVKAKNEEDPLSEKMVTEIINSKLGDLFKKVDEKFGLIDCKSSEMDKKVDQISKVLKKMQNSLEKKIEFRKPEEKAPFTKIPLKRRRFSTVEALPEVKAKYRDLSSESSDSKTEDSFVSNQDQGTVLEKDHDIEEMVYKLRVRGAVKMTDIWRLNNYAVIFNILELKTILDLTKIDELSKLKPWASRWKAKDKYFSNMKKVSSPVFNRNITKYDNSMAGITACLTENYLFHFDLYCTWRKLKLWLNDINNTIDLCITPSYPHKIRSVIAEESEIGFAGLLEQAIPYLTKQRLERTPHLILYSFIDDYPDDYLIKSQFSIIGRHQQTDLRKVLKIGST